MASGVYSKALESFASAGINLSSDNIKAVLVDTGTYSVNLATHQFLSDIPAGARVATSANLSGKTVTGGVFDAADVTYTAVTGVSVEAIVVYKDTGTATTSNLLVYIDSATSGLPVTPAGGDITIVWNASGIFKL